MDVCKFTFVGKLASMTIHVIGIEQTGEELKRNFNRTGSIKRVVMKMFVRIRTQSENDATGFIFHTFHIFESAKPRRHRPIDVCTITI